MTRRLAILTKSLAIVTRRLAILTKHLAIVTRRLAVLIKSLAFPTRRLDAVTVSTLTAVTADERESERKPHTACFFWCYGRVFNLMPYYYY